MSSITVRLPDGSARELPAGSTSLDLAASIGRRLAEDAVAAVVDGHETDLTAELSDGAEVAIITADSDRGRHVLRHSTAHVLAQAVTRLFPGATFSVGPAIEDGFYYDFDLPDGRTFTEDDLVRIEEEMQTIVAADQPFARSEMSAEEALELFSDQPYKCEIIRRVMAAGGDQIDAGEVSSADRISAYRNTDEFVDMCVGPHVPSTGRLGHFRLQRISGAYWRGTEAGPMLQRVYGTAWHSKKALAEHLHRLEEAAKRDHRRLAVDLDLLSFPSELGGGLAVWHPKGAIVRRLMEDYSRQRHADGGYQFVYTPHVTNGRLFETSGHLDYYADG
ncbi:MAG: TGS domain-containing protein, partial [Ilumatobacteraceae bacterium]